MIHIEGANTAAEMWSQLRLVKEARGKLDILSLHHRLYRTVANESTDITEHTTEMCHVQEELMKAYARVVTAEQSNVVETIDENTWDAWHRKMGRHCR